MCFDETKYALNTLLECEQGQGMALNIGSIVLHRPNKL